MTHVHPTRDDRVVAGLSEAVGGPIGEHAGRHPWWTPTRVMLLLTALCFAVGMLQKMPCSVAEGKDQQWVYSHMCYSDLRPLYVPRGFAEHAWPYTGDDETRDRYEVMEYPVGISYWAWGTSYVTHWLNGSPDVEARYRQSTASLGQDPDVQREQSIFLLVNAVGFALLALLSTWLLARVDRGRPWDAAAFALSPTLALTGLINWDLLAVALVAAALWSWSRGRPVLTGVLIGLGTAVKLYPLFLLGGLLVICLRQKRYVAFLSATVWAAIVWLLANAPAYLTGREQWKVFWTFNEERGADLGSLWMLADQAGDLEIKPDTINVLSWILFGGWCVLVFALGMLAARGRDRPGGRHDRVHPRGPVRPSDHGPRLAQLGYLIVMGFLIVNKVYSPQYVLWLLPLAVLARPRWRDQIVWQACEVFYFCTIWWYLGGYLNPSGGGDAGFYWLGIAVRVLGELYLAALIIRDLFRPEKDPASDRPDLVEPGPQPSTTTRSNAVAV